MFAKLYTAPAALGDFCDSSGGLPGQIPMPGPTPHSVLDKNAEGTVEQVSQTHPDPLFSPCGGDLASELGRGVARCPTACVFEFACKQACLVFDRQAAAAHLVPRTARRAVLLLGLMTLYAVVADRVHECLPQVLALARACKAKQAPTSECT